MASSIEETNEVITFKAWLRANTQQGFHGDALFKTDNWGYAVIAAQDMPADTTMVSIPFSLAITHDLAKNHLKTIWDSPGGKSAASSGLDELTERQTICLYICHHWAKNGSLRDTDGKLFIHGSYIDTLPGPSQLLTPLHFTKAELAAFKGTNLYGATLDREQQWKDEWKHCQNLLSTIDRELADELTWKRYLVASTYLSSRAFPSTLLSSTPTLESGPSSYPVLLPGIDALNHARAQPVSWAVSDATISLVLRRGTPAGGELLNNYGPKPNAELVLGYGFALAENADDTIMLKIGGHGAAPAVEVGRGAVGAERVWEQVLALVSAAAEGADPEDVSSDEERAAYEDQLEAAQTLFEMVAGLLDRVPPDPKPEDELRPEVRRMLEYYLEGQRDILQSLVTFAQEKEKTAVELAREEGVELVFE